MAKKPRTAKQLANDERLRQSAIARAEAKKAEKVGDVVEAEQPQAPSGPVMQTPSNENELIKIVEQLSKEVAELKAGGATAPAPAEALDQIRKLPGMQGAVVGPQGVQGQIFRYPLEKGFYPDPTPRLYDDPQLKRFSMRENYYFKWDVTGEQYEKYGISYAEPRFWIELYRFLFEDDGITPSGKMVLVARQMQHEDEFAARIIANKMQWDREMPFEDLMNEARYQRIRQWLLGIFTPPKIEQHRRRATTQVIDGKVVEVYDTEAVIDGESGVSKASTLKSQTGIGKVAVPE